MGITKGFGCPPGPNPGGSRSAAGCLIALAAVLSSVLSVSMAQEMQQTVEEVHVTTGQQLADAVAEWGATGSNMTIFIDAPYISMRNVTFTNYSTIIARSRIRPFSQGLLTITGKPNVGAPSKPTTILDAAMRSYLVPVPLTYPAQLKITNLVQVNQCETQLPLLFPGGTIPSSPFLDALMGPMTFAYRSKDITNVAYYGRQAAMAFMTYQAILAASFVPELERLASPEMIQPSNQQILAMDGFSLYSSGVESLTWSLGVITNMSLLSLANPDDPLLQQMRAAGTLMPPQFCNGTMMPRSMALEDMDPATSPVRLAQDQEGFSIALALTAVQTRQQLEIKGPPAMLVSRRGRYAFPSEGSFPVYSTMVLACVTSRVGDVLVRYPVIDTRQRVGLFELAPGARMILLWTVFTNMSMQVPAAAPPGLPPGSLVPSVFPLPFVKPPPGWETTWNTTPIMRLFNATFVLPHDEYLALAIMALKQSGQKVSVCASEDILQRVTQLEAGFHRVNVSTLRTSGWLEQIWFDQLQGWGMDALQLMMLPSSPVRLPSCAPGGEDGSALSRGALIGLSIGVCAFVLVAAALAAWFIRRKRSPCPTVPGSQGAQQLAEAAFQGAQGGESKSVCAMDSAPASKLSSSVLVCRPSVQSEHSNLVSGVRQAQESRHRLIESVVRRTSDSGGGKDGDLPDVQTAATVLVTPNQMHHQIGQLAAQLNPEGVNQVILAGMLGAGSGGNVMMGLWKGMHVAVKTVVYQDGHCHGVAQTATPRALMEAAIAASVGHPNLVATFHYDIKALAPAHEPGQPGGLQVDSSVANALNEEPQAYKVFLIQELCDVSLAVALADALFKLAETEIVDSMGVYITLLGVAQGLAYLHGKGIIHGDLKPANIMLKLAPGKPEGVVAKLCDFGLSTKLTPGATHVSNYSCGSPFYVAPEVVYQRKMSPASDVYSFGIIMWEMYSQCLPFVRAVDGTAVPHPMFPRFSLNSVPHIAYQDLFVRCCSVRPQDRPSAATIVSELQTLLQAFAQPHTGHVAPSTWASSAVNTCSTSSAAMG